MKNRFPAWTLLCVSLLFSCKGTDALQTTVWPVVGYYEGTELREKLELELKNGAKAADANGAEWELTVDRSTVKERSGATDYKLTWKLLKGEAKSVAVGVEFPFGEWSPENFVFVPSAVYDGNRFAVKDIPYPPYWYDPAEWRKDMPTTTTVQPTLGLDDGPGKIELTTGSASTPLMAFHSPSKKMGWIVQTTQGSRLGDYGLFIEENKGRTAANFGITAPAVREKRAAGAGFAPSGDQAADWKAGDELTIHLRVYAFPAEHRKDMLNYFVGVRKDMNPCERHEELPFSEAWKLVDNLYQEGRWDEDIHMYWLSQPGNPNASWNFIWQLGWVGGGQNTLAFLLQGSERDRQRAMQNIEVIFDKSQASSGFFNGYGNGKEFVGFGYGEPLKHNEAFVRSQGDWLYMAQRQFDVIESQGGTIPAGWKPSLQKLADAFARLWEKEGQFGQFVDVQTGELCIGGSTAGAVVPAGLALASKTYGNERYLEIAREAARKYHADFVLKGYTTGGPGEILSTPDSESAFALFETYAVLHEVTGEREWLDYAADLLPVCASWAVSYDYRFPAESAMGRIDARSCGSIWASVANKHSAPGICTWSGDALLKYYRATGDARALELLTDIAHGLPQYISRTDRPIGSMPPGGSCERVNLSDWEGKGSVGGNIFASCSWTEAASALTVTQLPGVYLQTDRGVMAVLDNISGEVLENADGKMRVRFSNPTKFPADVKIFAETADQAGESKARFDVSEMQTIHLEPGEVMEMAF